MSIENSKTTQLCTIDSVNCRTFINFLKKNGYEIKKANPNHRPGQGYSPPPYYGNVSLDTVIAHFEKEYGS